MLLENLLYHCVLAEDKCLFSNNILDFDLWISLKAFRSKVMVEELLFTALSAQRRLRVQSDLLDGTAFEVLPLVVCTKGPMYKKV